LLCGRLGFDSLSKPYLKSVASLLDAQGSRDSIVTGPSMSGQFDLPVAKESIRYLDREITLHFLRPPG